LTARGEKRADVFGTDGAASCFVDADIPVALCGVEDLIVVIRSGKDGGPASALIARKGETQRLKVVVEQIKAAGRPELL
jgi:mannose-1-phosphate guanylyltransferase/mannose-1-phosphate guanylyltransferase/mannose-6-phosphate isomerase